MCFFLDDASDGDVDACDPTAFTGKHYGEFSVRCENTQEVWYHDDGFQG